MKLLVLGAPGSGKTSWSREYVSRRRRSGSTVGGVLCPAIEKQGHRIGSNALDLLTGQEVPFARLSRLGRFKGSEAVGDYIISRPGIVFARAAIEKAIENRCDLVVIDEVGPLELRGGGLMPAVESALASPVDVLMVIRTSLREALQRHFPQHEFAVLADLTRSSQDTSEPEDRGQAASNR